MDSYKLEYEERNETNINVNAEALRLSVGIIATAVIVWHVAEMLL